MHCVDSEDISEVHFMPFGHEQECGFIGGDYGLEPCLICTECELETVLVCGPGCDCLQAATAKE
jgi:hypothetical protein